MSLKWILFACLAIASLAGCFFFRSQKTPVRVRPGAQAGDLFLTLCTVKVGKSRYSADCGILVVPENRINSGSRLIALPVKRIHSPADHPGEPIFYLAGGPGQSNMSFQPPAWLLAQHDVVMVGYRGVDGDPRLDCPDVSEAMLGVDGDLLSPASLDNLSAAMQTCAKRLQAAGVDLNSLTGQILDKQSKIKPRSKLVP